MNPRRLPVIATAVGIVVLLFGGVLGWLASEASGRRLTEALFATNQELARTLAAHSRHLSAGPDDHLLEDLITIWKSSERARGAFICIVDPESRVLVNTSQPSSVGKRVAALSIRSLDGVSARLESLLRPAHEWSGFLEAGEEEHLVSVAPLSARPSWLLFVHIPSAAVEQEIRAAVLPGIFSSFVLAAFLMPLSLVLMHRAYLSARRSENSTRNELGLQKAYFERLFQKAPVGIVVLDNEDRVVDVNREFESMFGYRIDEIQGQEINALIVPEDLCEEASSLTRDVLSAREVKAETIRHRSDGTPIWVDLWGCPIEVDHHQIGVYGLYKDVTRRKENELRWLRAARHDRLTGLPNRSHFTELAEISLESLRLGDGPDFTILLIVLRRFKDLVHRLGHRLGDKVLLEVSCRLSAVLGEGRALARTGDDNFAALLEGANLEQSRLVAKEIRSLLSEQLDIDGRVFFVDAVVGMVEGQARYARAEDLIRDADIAVHDGRTSDGISIFEPSMHSLAIARFDLQTALRQAIENEELALYYQPIVHLRSCRVVGFEGLLRWLRPEVGVVEPSDFVAAAEETGLIVDLGRWALNEACRQLAVWRSEIDCAGSTHISVNLSGQQLLDFRIVRDVRRALDKAQIPARTLKIEVTETALMETPDRVHDLLQQIRNDGVEVYLDDFGTGYSSLGRLQDLPVDVLKIDRSFLHRTREDPRQTEILRAIGTLARGVGKQAVAEGVETPEQLAILQDTKCCQLAQGYLFSRPLVPEEAARWIGRSLTD